MAGTNQRQTVDRRVNTSEGHYVRWEISVRDLHLLRSWHFVKNYRTFCKTSPTSWDFKMWFPEVREDGTASLSVSLTRIDSVNVDLEASIWVDIDNLEENLIFPKQSFTKGGMAPGSEMQETVEIVPLPNMRAAIHQNVIVLVTLTISSCHSSE
ncbi:hypothetical protein AVEN_30593-1 [Araneus ventricosus]|uniref:MATH domain-containing protein n=1 Tax=Araneus ventricosus TaxID=182803 RepID=A0A4Y2ES80_ARAVE|nr:hypothetical protein AVEN_30593-1 [Araneus ventricosus]